MGDDETVRDALNAPHLDVLVDSCIDVVEAIRAGSMPERGRKVLLDALDAVPRSEYHRTLRDYGVRFERMKWERDKSREALSRIAERYDPEDEEWRDPETGYIDPEAYTIGNVEDTAYIAVGLARNDAAKIARAALSADADADAEPCSCGHARTQHGASGCNQRFCGCLGPFPPEPSRAEGDAHAFAPVDTPDAVDPHTCHRCGEGRFHPSHLDPREGLDPDERLASDRGGDDGRSRAERAAFHALAKSTCGGWHSYHEPECGRCSLPTAARIATDAVLAEGGEVTAERAEADVAHWADLAHVEAHRADAAEIRVRELEALLHEVLGHITQEGHPGRPCVSTGWIPVEMVSAWRAKLKGDSDA